MCSVNKCCYGCSLRTGVLIIGIIDIILDILHPVATAVHYSLGAGGDKPESKWVTTFFVGELLVGMVDFVFAILLLVGLRKDSIGLLMSWWWWSVMQLSVHAVVGFTYLFISPDVTGVRIVAFFMLLALFSYMLTIVRSYVLSLKRKKRIANEVLLSEPGQMMEI